MMNIVVFTDLDDCFLSTKRKFHKDTPLTTAAFDANGNPRSFASNKQLQMLNILSASGAEIIPVTGRSHDVFNRVSLDILSKSWKVVSHGAYILDANGNADKHWLEHQSACYDLDGTALEIKHLNDVISTLIYESSFPARSYIVSEEGILCYLCVKCEEDTNYSEIFSHIIKLVSSSAVDFRLHVNGRNLALLPPYTDKAAAVKFIKERYFDEESLFISVGDSLTDLPFMQTADFSISPTNSQIFDYFAGEKLI
ncbi:HAD hydrolase family protein [Enterovibrio sp. ZSDZ42]|uniref:HAD hydrolase family protein n=1 Tax=Enterovibrio gelatinilyticus TaxID=2899819 RepID=A0ABT5QWK2_9GAMM|nr:HAD family hydrolase [Enterovibrio sp. ZSDZ42]MDD1792315.1 HAD hydrolase family protein [Enterovibrio sp. ZSDZ42]